VLGLTDLSSLVRFGACDAAALCRECLRFTPSPGGVVPVCYNGCVDDTHVTRRTAIAALLGGGAITVLAACGDSDGSSGKKKKKKKK
jgi:hypothetical protein